MKKTNLRELTLNGILIALVFIATYFIQIRLPISANGGLIHAGNIALFTIAIIFGKKHGAIAGAFGMGLFDIMSGWFIWAPGTFIVRGVMGYIIGFYFEKRRQNVSYALVALLAIITSTIWMLAGYYSVEGLLYGNWIAPIGSIPGNMTQIVIGWVVALPLSLSLRQTKLVKGGVDYE